MRVLVITLAVLSLLGCQNETNDRLARVEKKLDQIQQNQPSAPAPESPLTTEPAPAPAPAPATTPSYPRVRQDVAELLAPQGIAEFVGTKDDDKFGLIIADPKLGTLLYRRASEPGLYSVVRKVNMTLPLSDAQRAEMLAILSAQ